MHLDVASYVGHHLKTSPAEPGLMYKMPSDAIVTLEMWECPEMTICGLCCLIS
jgi:hypothetical protein